VLLDGTQGAFQPRRCSPSAAQFRTYSTNEHQRCQVYTHSTQYVKRSCAPVDDARETLSATAVVDPSLRKQMGELVREFFADAIQAMGGAKRAQLVLKNAGLRAPDGTEYSVRAVSSWAEKKNPKQPAPEVLFAVAELSGLSVDRFVLGEALEAKFAERVEDHEQRIGALEAQLWELAAMFGWELEHKPLPEGATLEKLMDDLRERKKGREVGPG
jgi:hypothetical protein